MSPIGLLIFLAVCVLAYILINMVAEPKVKLVLTVIAVIVLGLWFLQSVPLSESFNRRMW